MLDFMLIPWTSLKLGDKNHIPSWLYDSAQEKVVVNWKRSRSFIIPAERCQFTANWIVKGKWLRQTGRNSAWWNISWTSRIFQQSFEWSMIVGRWEIVNHIFEVLKMNKNLNLSFTECCLSFYTMWFWNMFIHKILSFDCHSQIADFISIKDTSMLPWMDVVSEAVHWNKNNRQTPNSMWRVIFSSYIFYNIDIVI